MGSTRTPCWAGAFSTTTTDVADGGYRRVLFWLVSADRVFEPGRERRASTDSVRNGLDGKKSLGGVGCTLYLGGKGGKKATYEGQVNL